MTTPTKSIQQLREGLEDLDWQEFYNLCPKLLDRLEAAEARITELQQLMAQGHSKARKHGLQRDALSRELYRTQMLLEGVSADYGDSPMAIQARPPVDDVSGLLDERLKLDAARIGELEAQLEAIGIALEWPGQDERTLLEVVKEAATWGVLRCQDRAEMHRLRTAQQPRDMADAPEDEYVLAKCGGVWTEVIFRDGSWRSPHMDVRGAEHLACWLPLPDQTEVKS